MMSDDLSANLCDGKAAVLQKRSAIPWVVLKSGVFGIGKIVNPTAIAVKRKRLKKKRKKLTNIHHEVVDKVMNTKCNILGYFTPGEILLRIFSEYLSMDDVSRFDIAICEKARREAFLILVRSNKCIFDGGKQDKSGHSSWHGIGFLSWLRIRGIEIKHLKCHKTISGTELLKFVNCGKRLQKLDLSNCENISDKFLRRIILSCLSLTELSLAWCRQITDRSVINIAESYPNLTSLKLSGINVSEKSIAMVAKNCSNLSVLDLSECDDIRDKSLIRIAENCPNLTELYLYNNRDITDTSFIRLAECCPNLRVLDVPECGGITDESVIKIAENCANLEHLNLVECGAVSDESIMRITECCSNLRILDLAWITDICVIKIADNCPNLTSLSLFDCNKISDTSIVRIAKSCPRLSILEICHSEFITDTSITMVAEHCPSLTRLIIDECGNVTDKSIVMIAKSCPCMQSLHLPVTITRKVMRLLSEVYPYIEVIHYGIDDSAIDHGSLDYDSTDDYASSMVGGGYDSDQYTAWGTRYDGGPSLYDSGAY